MSSVLLPPGPQGEACAPAGAPYTQAVSSSLLSDRGEKEDLLHKALSGLGAGAGGGTGSYGGHTRNLITTLPRGTKIRRQEVKILTFGSSPNWPNCTSFNKLRAVLMISLHFFGVSSTFPARKRQQAPVTCKGDKSS